MICHLCGFKNKENSVFCSKCGNKLTRNTHPPAFNASMDPNLLLQGRYKVIKQLGKGGMGVVYLANDNRFSNRICVVKEMKENLGLEEGEERRKAILRFNAEADLLAQMSHPNVPQVYDRFSEQNRHFLVMEFIAGMDLKQLLTHYMQQMHQPLPEKELAIFFFELCLTLEYLHNHTPQILHRDIKPENIMLSKSGKIKLVDFGIAKFIQTKVVGTSIGTQGYAAPEQYKGMVEARTDIYALGATFHHLLTGRNPQLETPFDYPSVRSISPHVSVSMSDLIAYMLQADLASRPENVREIIRSLKQMFPDIEQRMLSFPMEKNILLDMVKNHTETNAISLAKKYCSSCGHENKAISKFCIKCGKSLIEKPSTDLKSDRMAHILILENGKIAQNYPSAFPETIQIPDKTGVSSTYVILARHMLQNAEYLYLTEKLPAIVGKEVKIFQIIRNTAGAMEYMLPVTDALLQQQLFEAWKQYA